MSYKDNFVFWKLWSNNFFGSSDAFNLKLFGDKDRQQAGKKWNCEATMLEARTTVSFSSCQQNLIKTFQIEGMITLITKMGLTFS